MLSDFAINNFHAYDKTITNIDVAHISHQIEQSWIEIQNGLDADILYFKTDKHDYDHLYDTIQQTIIQLKNSPYQWHTESFCCRVGNNIFLCSFKPISTYPQSSIFFDNKQKLLNTLRNYAELSLIEKAIALYAIVSQQFSANEKTEISALLQNEISSDHRVLATLAAEILFNWGEPVVPLKYVSYQNLHLVTDFAKEKNTDTLKKFFEDRINVNAYNHFELVHPSYARQCVALAQQVFSHTQNNSIKECLDVGTGPGAALLMQKELLPDYNFIALEPSLVAYHHLTNNIKNIPGCEAIHADFLNFAAPNTYDFIISTGASHHLNTFAFLQKAQMLLNKNGVLIIADEMISPFSAITQRKKNVMLHHSIYILELLSKLKDIPIEFNQNEQILAKLMHNYIPLGFSLAKIGMIEDAEFVYKKLLHQLNALKLNSTISSGLVAFYRLMYLELEALVAGIDYEVEQKTYPHRLINLAKQANLECIYHECIHHTSDTHDPMHSGTHVFTFTKRKMNVGFDQ